MLVSNTTTVDTKQYDTSDIEYNNTQGELSQSDFLNLFITQLQNQDPTDPMDDSAMMEQTATFTQVELLTSMEKSLSEIAGGASNLNTQQLMMSASGYIGKLVEFDGNNTYLSDGVAAVSFEAEEVPFKTTVTIKDSEGNFVRSFSPSVSDTDMNTFYWNGTDADGNAVDEGKYTFSVVAIGTDGEKIDVHTYGNGLVTGVKTVDGELVYEVDGSDIPAEDVTSVRDATLGGA
ncbi:flagellar hook capping protein [Denitrovibrio acetiphilus DSM 12809]|uniref:Basal-body rod modification protein FlgD n=1 Tax=Denitrovibrio acetiphilus (strain DSM 12809 / NBRC 114555 / N2460) TaxID=522772 RepID=D4H2M7_DENA2|nr:flagellar hook capping FlgD N-terminal domain-containing protein [Denitrovibrio acetiphilus]ADD67088.1 flagellar hook capping protein [Denitrovibrio acetiphilus DSM 12809]